MIVFNLLWTVFFLHYNVTLFKLLFISCSCNAMYICVWCHTYSYTQYTYHIQCQRTYIWIAPFHNVLNCKMFTSSKPFRVNVCCMSLVNCSMFAKVLSLLVFVCRFCCCVVELLPLSSSILVAKFMIECIHHLWWWPYKRTHTHTHVRFQQMSNGMMSYAWSA